MIEGARRQSVRIVRGLAYRGRDGAARVRRNARIVDAVVRRAGPAGVRPLARRAAHLLGPRRFELEEAYTLGLLDPELPPGTVEASVSKREMIELQARLNPNEFWYLTEDKAIFYRLAEALGVRVPKLYAILCEPGPGWAWNGDVVADVGDWERLFRDRLPDTFVVKPARGYHGLDVRVIERRDGVLHQVGGEPIEAGELCRQIIRNRGFHIYVVQERLANHPDMPGGRTALQTARIGTFVGRDGTVRVLSATFKTAVEGNAIDNFRLGATGNLTSAVDPATGAIVDLMGVDEAGVMRDVEPPPGSNAPAVGSRLPMWDECCELVRAAAPHFLPMRSLGWDVAITPDGPVIVEANMWWDPVAFVDPPGVVGLMRRDLADGPP